jgi:hypothetical protein
MIEVNPTSQSGDGSLSLRGAILLGIVAWLLLAGSIIACVTKSRLTRPIGAYGGSCLGGIGDDCMGRLIRQQRQDDLNFLFAVFALSAIPSWLLAYKCYQSKYQARSVLRWSSLGAAGLILSVIVFPVVFALVLLDFMPTISLHAAQFVRVDPSVINRIPIALLDWRVLSASKRILESDDFVAQKALAQYAASGQPEEVWREILLTLANGNTRAKEQALICLGWRGDPRNLHILGEKLFTKDEPTTGVQYVLMAHYGKDGEAYVQRCLTESPSMQTRQECARVLADRGKPEAFKFYLDEFRRSDAEGRSRILQRMRTYVRNGEILSDKQLPDFLERRARQ